jgi:hypothetical protein
VLINYPNPVQRDDICRMGLAAFRKK